MRKIWVCQNRSATTTENAELVNCMVTNNFTNVHVVPLFYNTALSQTLLITEPSGPIDD